MKYMKALICSLIIISTFAHAEESTLDKAKSGAKEAWKKTKEKTTEIVDDTREGMSEFGEHASEFGRKASDKTKETSIIVWDKMKEVGSATADTARKGAAKIRDLVDQEDCNEDSALCFKNKE